ncbi:uncharacterized protein LOC124261352 [Haliotis rubra]|uniref:uncharacterized protein LOC124261352 n=1 Tax=Haliotis rubra TaxID=36100 RepID=UPI001EE61A0B|nr:uncharacterized protein LOC124261352 [Haliotis rubra]
MAACRIALLIGFAWAIVLQVDGQAVHYSERKASRQPVPYNSVYHAETGSSHVSPSHEPTVITLPPKDLKPTRQPVPYASIPKPTASNAFPDKKPHRQPVPRTDTKWKQQQREASVQGNKTYATSGGSEAHFNERRPSRQPVPSHDGITNAPETKTQFVQAHNQISRTPQSPSGPLWKKPETPWQPGIGGYQPYYLNYNSRPNNHLNWNPVMDLARQYQVKQQRYSPYGTGNPLSNWVLSGRRASTRYNMYGQMVPTDSYKGNTYDGHLSPFGVVDYNGPCRRLCTMYCSLGYDVDVKGCPACSCQRQGSGRQRYFGDAD